MKFLIETALQTGGSAGKGKNITSTLRLVDLDTNRIVYQTRFIVGNAASQETAVWRVGKQLARLIDEHGAEQR